MDVTGQLLDIEHKQGSWVPPGQTDEQAYDNVIAHMVVGKRVLKVKARGEDKARLTSLRDQIGKTVTIRVQLPEQLMIGAL